MSKKQLEIYPYPISKLPKSWQESVRFMGCGNARDARIRWMTVEGKTGYHVYCGEYPEEGADYLGKRKPNA